MVRVLDKMHYGVSYREPYDVIRLLPSDFMTFPVYIYMYICRYVIWMNEFFRKLLCVLLCVSLLFLCWLGILIKKKKYRGLKNCVKSSLDDRLEIILLMCSMIYIFCLWIRVYFHLWNKRFWNASFWFFVCQ